MFEDLSTLALGSCCFHSFRSLLGGGRNSDSALRAKKSEWRESQGLPGDANAFENSQCHIVFMHGGSERDRNISRIVGITERTCSQISLLWVGLIKHLGFSSPDGIY